MFAMGDEEMFAFFLFLVAAAVVVWLVLRFSLRREKLKTIQMAIESGKLDTQTRDRLIDALAQDQRRTNELWQRLSQSAPRLLRTVIVGGGWLCLVISAVVFVAMISTGNSRYYVFDAAIGMGIGFALVSLPVALREAEGRRAGAAG